MKKYSCVQAMYMSFYSRDLYRDVANNWGASVLLYLLVLLALSWIVVMVAIQPSINRVIIRLTNELSSQVPLITIEKGIVKTPENKPYFIKDNETGEIIAIIDTSGHYNDLCLTPDCSKRFPTKKLTPPTARILLTKDMVIYSDGSNIAKIQKLSNTFTMNVKPNEIQTFINNGVGWLGVIIFPFILFLSFLYRLIQAIIYAVVGKIVTLLGNIPLRFSQIIKLTIISITPAIILNTIFQLTRINFLFENLFYFIVAIGYLIFALLANKNN